MAFRDVLLAPLTSVYVLDGLPPRVLEALPDALAVVVASRRAAGRRWPGPVIRPAVLPRHARGDAIRRSIHRAPPHLTTAQLIDAAGDAGFAGLPVAITISGRRAAIATAHGVFDGVRSLDLVHDLLDAAAGAPLQPEPAQARHPVLQALRRVPPARMARFLVQRGRHAGEVPAPPLVAAAEPTSVAFALHADDLAALRRYREPDRSGRPTLHSRLASASVAALREVAAAGPDVPIDVTTDLRYLVDGDVDGNFITAEQVGSLHGDQWAPGALAARLVQLKDPSRAVALVTSSASWLARTVVRQRPVPGEKVTITLATTKRALPADADPSTVTATSLHGSPTFVFVWQSPARVLLSIWSSSSRFDLSRFESAFRDGIARRAAG